jgi:hypothetical protein
VLPTAPSCRKDAGEVRAEGALWVLGAITVIVFMVTVGYGIGEY